MQPRPWFAWLSRSTVLGVGVLTALSLGTLPAFLPGMRLLTTLTIAGAVILFSTSSASAGSQLSAVEAKRVANQHYEKIRACYKRHAMKQRSATGKVALDVVVARSGSVKDVDVIARGVRGKAFTRCVSKNVLSWKFPSSKSATEVRFPYFFQHTKTRRTRTARR